MYVITPYLKLRTMIGRTLDTVLSMLQMIGKNCGRPGEDSMLLHIADAMRYVVLPIEKYTYISYNDNGETKTTLFDNEWSPYFKDEWKLKRACGKAFEQRRRANIGTSFYITGTQYTGFGNFNKNYEVRRIRKNAVIYRRFLIASDEDTLLEHKDEGYTPILYRGVIW